MAKPEITITSLADISPESVTALVNAATQLVDRVEYDVNGTHGKGGNGGLTSSETVHAAGMTRIALSKFTPEAGQ
jgi:hypothetical protein